MSSLIEIKGLKTYFDTDAGTFRTIAGPGTLRGSTRAITLDTGHVVIFTTSGNVYRFDSNGESFIEIGQHENNNYPPVLLPSGKILIVGGGPDGTTVYSFDPESGSTTSESELSIERGDQPTATLLPDGSVVVIGGGVPPGPGRERAQAIGGR